MYSKEQLFGNNVWLMTIVKDVNIGYLSLEHFQVLMFYLQFELVQYID